MVDAILEDLNFRVFDLRSFHLLLPSRSSIFPDGCFDNDDGDDNDGEDDDDGDDDGNDGDDDDDGNDDEDLIKVELDEKNKGIYSNISVK